MVWAKFYVTWDQWCHMTESETKEKGNPYSFLVHWRLSNLKQLNFVPKLYILTWTTCHQATFQIDFGVNEEQKYTSFGFRIQISDRKSFFIFITSILFCFCFCFTKTHNWNDFWLHADNSGKWMFVKVGQRARSEERSGVE